MTSPTSRTTELARKLGLLYQIVETNVTFEKKEARQEEMDRMMSDFAHYCADQLHLRQTAALEGKEPPPAVTLGMAWRNGWVSREGAKTTAMVRKDLFGLADILVLTHSMTIAIQATTGGNLPARRKKIDGEVSDQAKIWLMDPHRKLQIWGWRELSGGKLKWQPRIMEVVLVAGKLEFMEHPGTNDNLQSARVAWGLLL